MTLAERVRDGLRDCGVGPADRVLAAVSGGLDSTALLRLLVEVGQPVVAAHVDHQLREGSAEDGAFVAALADELGVPAVLLTVEVAEGNVQAEARRARYAALAEAASAQGCPVVATAHTVDDQAETVLAALVRGAGLRGLAGMPARRYLGDDVALVRPMLGLSREEVETSAQDHRWHWREDPSNASEVYGRNWLRRNVMHLLVSRYGSGVVHRIAASSEASRAALELVISEVDAAADRGHALRLADLRKWPVAARGAVLAEALAEWAPNVSRTRALVERLAALVDAEVGARVEAAGLCVWREREVLRFDAGEAGEPGGRLGVTPLDAVPTRFGSGPWAEVVDADRADGPRVVRRWRAGDRIRPIGLDGSQLVSDLLRDRGVPRADRAAVPVVLVGGEVAWVVGHRLAAFVAVGPETTRAARWTWHAGPDPG